MEQTSLEQNGNKLKVTLSFTNRDIGFMTKISRKYVISGLAEFQMQVIAGIFYNDHVGKTYHNYFFVRFTKLSKDDDFKYVIKFNSKGLAVTNKFFTNDDGTWHLVHDNKENTFTFDVIVHMDVVPTVSSFASLHEDMELTDFELRGEGGSVHMHKAVLAASSPVLMRMLAGDWRETKEGVIDIPGTSKTTLEDFKNYLYLHTLPDVGLEQLVLLSLTYMMPDLEKRCVDKLVFNMTAENACDLLEFAAKHGVRRMLVIILKHIQIGSINVDIMYENLL